MPKISVVMPVYNSERYLREAIDSILNQTFTDFEFIIIDDGSKDSSPDIVRSYTDKRIRFYQNEHNMGVAATLNRGLDLATGEYIARMDSDDISMPERFEKQLTFMDRHPDVAVCATGIQIFGSQYARRIFSSDAEQLKIDLLFNSCFAHPSVMMRSHLFCNKGYYYDNSFNKMEDYELWDRVSQRHALTSIPDVLLKYRMHPNQITQNLTDTYLLQMRALKTRQMKTLGIDASGSGFEAYLRYCVGNLLYTESEFAALDSFFNAVESANKSRHTYDPKKLHDNLVSVRYTYLNRMELKDALKMGGLSYCTERLFRRIKAKVNQTLTTNLQRKKLNNKNFTIISNNCWGGFIYQKYGLSYKTPTIGLYILGDDFVKFCANLEYYLALELKFIPWEASRFYPEIKNSDPYPVAELGDIEIYFMHYSSEAEALEKWNRRKKRIVRSNMIFKLSQREHCSKEDIERFMALPLPHKICFAYDEVTGTVQIPELRGFVGDEQPLTDQNFDELSYLNGL